MQVDLLRTTTPNSQVLLDKKTCELNGRACQVLLGRGLTDSFQRGAYCLKVYFDGQLYRDISITVVKRLSSN